MNFHLFRREMFDSVCFGTNQVYAWQPGFDKNNLGRWVGKGLLVKLRNGYYSFPEYLGKADYSLYIANRIYRPSYVSLHTALAFYGLIPEAVVQVTSVTSLKTNTFTNPFGEYTYQSVRQDLVFGYDLKPLGDGLTLLMAGPEKALLDLLYLYPFYRKEEDFRDLRLDEDFLQDEMNMKLFMDYVLKFSSKALEIRARIFLKTYGL